MKGGKTRDARPCGSATVCCNATAPGSYPGLTDGPKPDAGGEEVRVRALTKFGR
jgi:hypothetical protein